MTARASTARGTHGEDLQCVTPDDTNQMGTTGADVTVADGSSVESTAAPANGVVIVGLPGIAVRIRIGVGATAGANDALYTGPDEKYFKIGVGEVVSIRGDGGAGTATVCMAR